MSAQNSAHITAQTALKPAINGWEMYLNDQGRSPHTVKAFLGYWFLFFLLIGQLAASQPQILIISWNGCRTIAACHAALKP